ncbi:MAG: M48 family metallopeptidase [Clostridia bacterium]|nr:M48 family metallopeptidase [Clostridia bacterium]
MSNVKIVKQNRKTISITVLEDESILIKCPKRLSDREALNFLNKKQHWISSKIEQIRLKNSKFLTILNKTQSLVLGKFVSYVNKTQFDRLAVNYLTQKTQEISQFLGLKYNSLSFKHYRSRWGCCDIKKNIILNYKLYMLDEYTIKCVIIHELLHTLYLNHGQAFKIELKKLIGNPTIYKNRLKEVGFLLKY